MDRSLPGSSVHGIFQTRVLEWGAIAFYTWTLPDGQYQNQIDYILCRQRWRSSIQLAKIRPGADCGSDHELLIAKFRLKLKKVGKTTRLFRYDLNQIPYYYLEETQAGIKIAGRNINNLRYTDDITLMAESEEEIKSFLMKMKEESEKVGLKFNIQKTKIMASGPITPWEVDGKQWKQCQTLFFGAPKSLQMVIAAMKLKDTYSLEGKL